MINTFYFIGQEAKIPGITQIELSDRVVSFVAHDTAIDKDDTLKQEILRLQQEIEDAGIKPDLSLVDTLDKNGKQLTDD